MAQDLSYEDPDAAWFITIRTIGSRLWFVNNPLLEWYILAFLAKYQQKFGVILHGFVLLGNHWHMVARFPRSNKSAFLRAFDSMVAKLVNSHVPKFYGGKLWARPARPQLLPEAADVEHWMLYAVLNPIKHGLVQKCSDYPGYNSFSDSISGVKRKFKLVDWTDFNNRKRGNSSLTKEDCTKTYELVFTPLPGYEHLSHKEYREVMLKKAEKRRCQLIEERLAKGQGFAGLEALQKTEPGSPPKATKKSTRHTKRPLVLSLSREAKDIFVNRYFRLLEAYREASKRYRAGDLTVEFPPGTYRPVLYTPI